MCLSVPTPGENSSLCVSSRSLSGVELDIVERKVLTSCQISRSFPSQSLLNKAGPSYGKTSRSRLVVSELNLTLTFLLPKVESYHLN